MKLTDGGPIKEHGALAPSVQFAKEDHEGKEERDVEERLKGSGQRFSSLLTFCHMRSRPPPGEGEGETESRALQVFREGTSTSQDAKRS